MRKEAGAKSKGENSQIRKWRMFIAVFFSLCFVKNAVGSVIEETEGRISRPKVDHWEALC